jgi:hypothetical protein
MLKGKLYDSNMKAYYQNLSRALSNYRGRLAYLINLTNNSYIPLLSGYYKRVQRAPYYDRHLAQVIFQDEQVKIARLLRDGQAILVTEDYDQIPRNYRVVMDLKVPKAPYEGQIKYIAVPEKLARDFKSLPDLKE